MGLPLQKKEKYTELYSTWHPFISFYTFQPCPLHSHEVLCPTREQESLLDHGVAKPLPGLSPLRLNATQLKGLRHQAPLANLSSNKTQLPGNADLRARDTRTITVHTQLLWKEVTQVMLTLDNSLQMKDQEEHKRLKWGN